MITLTELELERMAEKFCENVENVCENNHYDHADHCDLCPMTDLCGRGKNGFVEFLKNKGGIYNDEL